MKPYFTKTPGATFFLGSSRTLVYHKDDVEIIYKTKTPSGKTFYAHVYLMLGGEKERIMEATVFNNAQLHILRMMSYMKTNEELYDLKNVLSDYYAKKDSK